jgi:hypothetical protein
MNLHNVKTLTLCSGMALTAALLLTGLTATAAALPE